MPLGLGEIGALEGIPKHVSDLAIVAAVDTQGNQHAPEVFEVLEGLNATSEC